MSMDNDKIQRLARAHATLIMNYSGADKQASLMIASQVLNMVAMMDSVSEPTPPSQRGQEPGIPEPPRTNLNPGTGHVLSPEGYQCTCHSCGKVVYTLGAPIMSREMGVNALLKAFVPSPGAPEVTRDMLDVIRDKDGNTYMDCPLCKGEKTLQFVGTLTKPATGPVGESKQTGISVGSVGAGEVGSI